MHKRSYILYMFFLLMTACNQQVSNRQNYLTYINDPRNNITQSIHIGETTATMKYLPGVYRQLTSSDQDEGVFAEEYFYFSFRLDRPVSEKPEKEKLMYLNFDLQDDLVLLSGKDSIPASICQKIVNGRSWSHEYMLAFERGGRSEKDTDFALLYKDRIFGIGTVAFVYNGKDIRQIPTIKTETTP